MPSGGHFGAAGGGVASDASAGPDVLTGEDGRGPRGAFYRSKLGRESGTTVECLPAKWSWRTKQKRPKSRRQIPTCFKVRKSLLVKTLASTTRRGFRVSIHFTHTRTTATNFLLPTSDLPDSHASFLSPLIGAAPVDDVAAACCLSRSRRLCIVSFTFFAPTRK